MNCTTARRLLHLNRSGERSPAEETGLRRHLEMCSSCSLDAQRLGRLAEIEERWRTSNVAVPDLRHLRARVLKLTSDRNRHRPTILDRMFFLQQRSITRLAYAVASVAAVGWFIASQTQVHLAQSRLQEKTSIDSALRPGPEVVYAVDPRSAAGIASMIQPLTGTISWPIEVPQSDVDKLERLTEHELQRASIQGPERRARLTEFVKTVRSSIVISIRFRTPGV